MQNDSGSRLPGIPHRDLWKLPKIIRIKIERVRYPKPRKHVVGGRVLEVREGVEILVETAEEIPVRALSAALHVGGVEIAENEQLAPGKYRFFVLDESDLKEGAPISLGWVGAAVASKPARAKFRYKSPRA